MAPLLVGIAWADEDAAKADATTAHRNLRIDFVFLTGPNKGQVVRVDNLPIGGVYPATLDGSLRNETPLNLVILARSDPAVWAKKRERRQPKAWWRIPLLALTRLAR